MPSRRCAKLTKAKGLSGKPKKPRKELRAPEIGEKELFPNFQKKLITGRKGTRDKYISPWPEGHGKKTQNFQNPDLGENPQLLIKPPEKDRGN